MFACEIDLDRVRDIIQLYPTGISAYLLTEDARNRPALLSHGPVNCQETFLYLQAVKFGLRILLYLQHGVKLILSKLPRHF